MEWVADPVENVMHRRGRNDGARCLRASSLPSRPQDRVAQLRTDPEIGFGLEPVEKRKQSGDQQKGLRFEQDAEQADRLQPERDRGGATSALIHQYCVRLPLEGERDGGDLSVVEAANRNRRGQAGHGNHLLDELREDQAVKPRILDGEALKLARHRLRSNDLSEELRQQGFPPDEAEVQNDGGVGDDDHFRSRERSVSRSCASISSS